MTRARPEADRPLEPAGWPKLSPDQDTLDGKLIPYSLVFGLTVRAVPILWGTSFIDSFNANLHPDEPLIFLHVFQTPLGATYADFRQPLLLQQLSSAVYALFFSVMRLLHRFAFLDMPLPESARMICRLTALSLSLGSLCLIASPFRRLIGDRAALFALAVFATMPYPVVNASLCWTDSPAAFFILLCFLVMARYAGEQSDRTALALGLAQAFACATKYYAAIVVIPALLTVVRFSGPRAPRHLLLSQGAFAAALCLLSLPFFKDPALLVSSLRSLAAWHYGLGPWDNFRNLAESIGPLALCFFLAHILLRHSAGVFFPSLILATVLAYGYLLYPNIAPRYVIAVSPLIALTAGISLERMTRGLNGKWVLAAALAAQLGILPYLAARYQDSRYQFAHFAREHFRPGERVAFGSPDCPCPAPDSEYWPGLDPRTNPAASLSNRPQWVVFDARSLVPDKAARGEYECAAKGGRLWPGGEAADYRLRRVFRPPGWPVEFNGETYYLFRETP